MANELKMAIVESIRRLLSLRWSQRRIAKELGIDRGAVARHARSMQADPKPAIPPTGSEAPKPAGLERPPAPGSDPPGCADGAAADLASNEDVKEFYLGMGGGERKSFRDVKSYKRRKRWLA